MNITNGFNAPKDGWRTTLRRSLTLGRDSKNRSISNSTNNALNSKIEFMNKTATLERLPQIDKVLEKDVSHVTKRIKILRTENLTEMTKKVSEFQRYSLAGLENIKQRFIDNEKPPISDSGNGKIFLGKTLNNSKIPSKIGKKLDEAKNLFQNDYKKAKKSFKQLLLLNLLKEEKPTIELYLATIYLLQGKIYKAEKHLKGKAKPFIRGTIASLTQIMSCHVSRLIKEEQEPQTIKGPFLAFLLYEETESFSEDEKIMAKALSKEFNIKKGSF
ncbi:MAG: hypothetical protein ACRCU0_00095 [Candidatus Rhabdochlamydia sp.]